MKGPIISGLLHIPIWASVFGLGMAVMQMLHSPDPASIAMVIGAIVAIPASTCGWLIHKLSSPDAPPAISPELPATFSPESMDVLREFLRQEGDRRTASTMAEVKILLEDAVRRVENLRRIPASDDPDQLPLYTSDEGGDAAGQGEMFSTASVTPEGMATTPAQPNGTTSGPDSDAAAARANAAARVQAARTTEGGR